MSLLLTYYYIKQCLTYHLDRTRPWSKLETLVSKWSTLYGTPFLSSEVTVLCWCLHMMLYLHLLQYQISFIIDIIMFLHVKIKKVKFIKNLPTFAKLVYLFVLFVLVIILFFIFAGGGGKGGYPWSYGCWIFTPYAISAYHLWSCEIESHSWRGVLDTTLRDKVCQWLAADRWFSLGTLVSFTNKTVRHDIAEALLKLSRNLIALTLFAIIDIDV